MRTLCGGTEHGFASFDDGTVIARNTMQSKTLTIRCFNNGATVVRHASYELVKDGLMLEFATMEDGKPVSTIVLRKVSED